MQRGLVPILTVTLIVVLGIGGYFVYTNYSKVRTQPTQYVQPIQTPAPSQDPTTNWKTDANTYYSLKLPENYDSKDMTRLQPSDTPEAKRYLHYLSISDEYRENPHFMLSEQFQAPWGDPILAVLNAQGKILQKIVDEKVQTLEDDDYTLKLLEKKVIDKTEAVLIVNNTEVDDPQPSYFTYYWVKGPNLYIYQYTSLDESPVAIFDQILSTFKFTNEL